MNKSNLALQAGIGLVALSAFGLALISALGGQSQTTWQPPQQLPVATASAGPVVGCLGATYDPDGRFILDCQGPPVNGSTVTVTGTPSTTTTTVTVTPSPTVAPTTVPPTTTPPPTTPPAAGFPGASNTGATGTLTPYTGSCTITAANTVIENKWADCVLSIKATGVQIKNSKFLGISGKNGASFTASDVTIDVTPYSTNGAAADGISGTNFTVLRANVFGSNRGIYCAGNGTIKDSWVHGTEIDPTSAWHASAVRVEQNCTLEHNTLACDWLIPTPVDGGCSADMTMYPDSMTNHHNTIKGNLFVANPTGAAFCGYFGDIPSKPYGGLAENATYIVVTDNVFQRGSNGKCAAYGPADSWGTGRTGNVWSNNRFDNGVLYTP